MPNYNKIVIIGHLGRDPETKSTLNGTQICNFSVAVSETYHDEKKTEWFNVIAFKKTAEICQKYLHKGDPAMVEGKLQTRTWDASDGTKKTTVEIVASNIVLLGSKPAKREDHDGNDRPIDDSDIPF